MSNNTLAPKPKAQLPAVTMSSPRLQPWILAAPRTQVLLTSWRTITRSTRCYNRAHADLCTLFLLDGADVLHADLSVDVWMRHPIRGAR